MSDSEKVFETPEPVTLEVEPVDEPIVEQEPEPEKVKRKRKPMSDERKAQLREQLKRGRETSLKNRQLKASKKKTFKKALSIEDQEKEEQALEVAKVRILEAEMRKDQRETAKHARAEASDAMTLAKQLRSELDELKSERAASKARKAAIREEQEAIRKDAEIKIAAAKAAAPPPPPPKKVLSARELAKLVRGL